MSLALLLSSFIVLILFLSKDVVVIFFVQFLVVPFLWLHSFSHYLSSIFIILILAPLFVEAYPFLSGLPLHKKDTACFGSLAHRVVDPV
jgi:hypothetical protein